MIGRIRTIFVISAVSSFLLFSQFAAAELYCNEWEADNGQIVGSGDCYYLCGDDLKSCPGIWVANKTGWDCVIRWDPCPSGEKCWSTKRQDYFIQSECTCTVTIPNCPDPVFIPREWTSDWHYCNICPF